MALRVVELFAGVGGFRQGLEQASLKEFRTVWFNQWEPANRKQHAHACYVEHFPETDGGVPADSNVNICDVDKDKIPPHDLLVGGFPCQDYSVATTLDKAGGLKGKKGVLWWEITKVIEAQKKRPSYLILENVDRLLKSPASKRGRDFGVVLACLRDLGYRVEWRVINAADYGQPQRRRRVFIFAAHKGTAIGKRIARDAAHADYLHKTGFFASEFKGSYQVLHVDDTAPSATLPKDIPRLSAKFEFNFQNAGVMVDGKVWTRRVVAAREGEAHLVNFLDQGPIPEELFVDMSRWKKWQYAKGSKKESRKAANGFEYNYAEGRMQFPDLLDAPARTILTGEAGKTPNRSTHVILDPQTGRPRFLTPLEVERVMGFPDGWTKNLPPRWRYFTMGNALVVPIVTRIGRQLLAWLDEPAPESLTTPKIRVGRNGHS